jgi:hypothetical protein
MKRKLLLFLTLITSILVYGQEVIFNESNVNHTSGLAIFENQLYIAGFFSSNIYKVNLSSQNENPIIILEGIDRPSDIEISEGILYISSNPGNTDSDKIIKLDLNETNPNPEEIVSIPNPDGITIYNNKIYASSGTDIFTIDLSTTNPSPVLFLEDVTLSSATNGICIYNNSLYATNNAIGELVKYNLNSSTPSREIIFNNFEGRGLTVRNNKIYSTGDSPTKIFEIDPINEIFTEIAQPNIPTGWDIITNSNSIFVSNLEGGEVLKFDFANLSVENFTNKSLNLYPNPTSDFIEFSEIFQNSEIVIYDLNGRIIKKAKLKNTNKLNISDLQNGIYIIQKDRKRIGKIIKN